VPLGLYGWTIKNNPDNSNSDRVNDTLTELYGGPHLGVKKTLDKVWQRYYWLNARNNVEK
jgi:hypothetical protein